MDAESLKQVNEKLEKYLAEQAQGDGKLSSSTDEGPSLAADNPTKPEKKEADGKQNQSSHTELVSYSGKSTSVAAKALSNQEQEDDDDDEGDNRYRTCFPETLDEREPMIFKMEDLV